MLKALKEHLSSQFKELSEGTFLLACSGGVDSVVLAHLLAQLRYDFVLAHCNFRLRGDESDLDATFVVELAMRIEKEVLTKEFDTNAYVAEHRCSIQEAARELRYNWFNAVVEEKGLTKIVTAHHADDSLETFLINLSRGTGIDGLLGIPERNNRICRPLLPFARAEILNYASEVGLEWREDSSNEEQKYLRNKIRHNVVPALKSLHPSFLQNFERTRAHLQESNVLIDRYTEQLKRDLFQENEGVITISIDTLKQFHPLKPYLYVLFKEYGFTQWNDIEALLDAKSGKSLYSKTHRLNKDRTVLLLQPIPENQNKEWQIPVVPAQVENPFPMRLSFVDQMENKGNDILYADKDTLEDILVVRKYKKGDYFYPFGMRGKKKLSKYFKDQKYSVNMKEAQWLLTSGENIVWVVGQRTDNRFKVTKTTKKIVKISVNI